MPEPEKSNEDKLQIIIDLLRVIARKLGVQFVNG